MAITNARRQYIRDLQQRKARRKYGAFVVEGLVNVGELLASRAELEVLAGTPDGLDALRQNLPNARFPAEVYELGPAALQRVSAQVKPNGVVAVARAFDYPRASFTALPRLLYLDGVNDPGNAGTLIRTAEWFGLDGVCASPGSVDWYNPKVVAAARGSLFRLPHRQIELADLAAGRPGGRVIVADLGGRPARRYPWSEEGILVVGNESHGPGAAAKSLVSGGLADVVTIQGAGGDTESLNAGIAGGILMALWGPPP